MKQQDPRASLKARLDENYNAFVQEWLKLDPLQMIGQIAEIAATRKAHEGLKSMGLSDSDAAYFLRFQNPLEMVRDQYLAHTEGVPNMVGADMEVVVERICDAKDLDGDYPLAEGPEMRAENEAAAVLDGIIHRASEEQKEYLASLERMTPAEIIERSAETDALDRLLSDLVHDSYALEYEDLCCLAQEDRPLHTLYEFVRGQEEPFDLDAITPILKAFNEEYASGQVQEGVTLC